MQRNVYSAPTQLTLFLTAFLTLVSLTSFKAKINPITVKKGDTIEYQVTAKKNDKRIIDMFTYMNESGTAVSGLRCTPASLNKTFVAKMDEQKLALVISLHHLSKEVINAKILVNGVVVQEASTGNGIIQLDLEVNDTER